jgi:nitric-oxide synthase
VSLDQGQISLDSHWLIPGPGRSRGRSYLEPREEPSLFPCSEGCLVASEEAETGFAADPGMLPGRRSLAAGESFDADRLFASAERFITLFHRENRAGPPGRRLWQVRAEIAATGTYWHTPAELEFGARVAWRNSSRCIGRLYWHSLRVRDRRQIAAAPAVAAESAAHLREATNNGRIRPLITVFAPDTPGRPGPRILNPQLVRYAAHQTPGGAVTGDPPNAAITRLARDLGWPAPRPPGRFDILPLLIRDPAGHLTRHDLPPGTVLEVPISHPHLGWFTSLGLRWYTVPVISDMYLDIGGVCYPAAPFNGWYMCTEIGSRDLGDTSRYNQLPLIARHMGLDTTTDRTLWKDKTSTELNLAVLHSFTTAGITISDHHTESARFLQHIHREHGHGRPCPADWTWIVPPTASSTTPVFHQYYDDFDQTPNFYHHPPPALPEPADLPDRRPGRAVECCAHPSHQRPMLR